MKNRLFLIIILLGIGFKGYTQSSNFDEILTLNTKSLGSFQEYLYSNNFLLYKTNTDLHSKTDTISFINKEKVIIGRISNKRGNTLIIKNFEEPYFQFLIKNLQEKGFVFLTSEVSTKNEILNRYINIKNKNTAELQIQSNSNESRNLTNTYIFTLTRDPKFDNKYKSFLRNYNN